MYDNTDSVRGYGNVLAVQEYSHTDAWITLADWITLLADSSRKPIRETKTDYFPNTTAYIVNQPARVRVYAGNECKAETWYIYGAYYTGNTYTSNLNGTYKSPPLNTALLVKTEQALDACSDVEKIDTYDAKWAVTRMAYDPFSNQTILDQVGNASDGSQNLVINTTYDSVYQLFPVSQNLNGSSTYVETARYYGVNEISGHSGVAIWGAMQEHCGVNEVCTRQVYDQFGRRARRWEGVDKSNNWGLLDDNALVVWLYATFGGDQSANAITEWRNPRAEGYFVRKLYNGLGQLIQEQRPYQGWRIGGGQEILVDYLYDTFGQQTRASTPRLTPSYSSGDLRRPAVWTGGYTQTDYDARGAAFQTVAPNGEQQRYNYAGRAYAHFGVGRNGDTNKMLKWEEYDELGRPKAVHTYTLDNNRWVIDGRVALTHDILGNLTEVSHPNNIGATSIRYDLGGRKTKLIDPDLGTWHYAYDRQGNLLRQTDARKQTTCLYYDAFGRLRDQYFRNDSNATTLLDCPTNLTTYDLSYRYDQSQSDTNRSRGQVTQVVRRRGSAIIYQKDLRYNANGLLASETIVTLEGLSAQYTTSYGYDAYLRPNKTTYPDNEEVTLTYNGMGLPKKLTSNLTTSALVDNADYDAAGRSTLLNFPAGGNLWRRNSYAPFTQQDSNGGRQVTAEVGTGINGNYGNRLYLDYQYDSFGNLKQLRELFGGTGTLATFGFTYDTQNRLKSGFGQDYTYDDAGRLTNYEGATFTLNNNVPVHTVKNSGYAYDANGNVRTRGSYTLEWDAENHLSAVKNGSTLVESYLYDLDGLRIKRSSSAGATYYLNALAEVAINATPTATPTRTPTPTVTATPCNTSPSFMAVPGPTGTPCPQATATQRPTLPPTATPTRGSPTPTPGEPTATPRPTNTPRPTVVITPTPCDSSSIFAPIPVPTVGPDPCNSSVMVSDVEAAQVAAPIPGASGAVYLPLIQQGEAPPPVEASAIDDPLPLTKYYYFNGQRIAMRQADGTLLYLHGDHLGSTSLVTKADGTIHSDQGYRAYGRYRRGGALPTDHRFTGQKLDPTGLYYYNARYYDPEIGQFISPDTIVPDSTNLFDYNRYMYTRGNPMMYNDPTGHCIFGIDTLVCAIVAVVGAGAVGYGVGRVAYEAGMQYSPTTDRIRRDQIGGSLVTNLSETIAAQAKAHSISPVLVAAVIRHESAALERRIFTLLPSTTPGTVADSTEYAQSLLQGGAASIGIGQMQVRRARELEELGYAPPVANDNDRRQALLDPNHAVGYVTGMLHYLSDQLQTVPGYSSLSQDEQTRLILIGYNQGWDILQHNINELGFAQLINAVGYDNQTFDEYVRWMESQ